MPLDNPYQRYRQTAVNTSEPADLVVMTYEAVVRWVMRGKTAIASGDVVEAHEALINAQKLVANLSISLDFERGGGIAQNLRSIYDYLIDRLVAANVQKKPEILDEIIGLVQPLLQAWRMAVTQTRTPARVGVQAGA